jgi:hypothetical protein
MIASPYKGIKFTLTLSTREITSSNMKGFLIFEQIVTSYDVVRTLE